MSEALVKMAFLLGSAVCHQMPSHSLFVGGRQLPLCARCTGIHLGFWLALVLFAPRRRVGTVPSWTSGTLLGLAAILTLLDVLSVGFGLRPGSNLTRLATGLLLGYSMGVLAAGLLLDSSSARLSRTKESPWALLGGLGLAGGLGALAWFAPGWLYLPLAGFLGASVLAIHWFLLGVLGRFLWAAALERPANRWIWALAGLGAAGYIGGLLFIRGALL